MSKPKKSTKSAAKKTERKKPAKLSIDSKGHASIQDGPAPTAEAPDTSAAKPAKGKAAKVPKEGPAREPRQDLVVFAFRLPRAERDAIHKAAGPAGASRFIRRVAAAAAGGDEAQLHAILEAVAKN